MTRNTTTISPGSTRVSPSTAALPALGSGGFTGRLLWITAIATIGGLLFGYDTGVTNGALAYMVDYFQLDSLQEGYITFFLLIGAAAGAMLGGRAADAVGRKRIITVMALVFIVGAVGCVVAFNLEVLLASRFILGLAVGASSVVVPTYIAEVAPHEKRGGLVSRNEFMLVVGQFLAFLLNAIIGNVWGSNEHVWRYMLAIAVVPAVLLFIGMLAMPESPRWLAGRGRHDEALAILKTIRSDERARAEIAVVEHLESIRAHEPRTRIIDILRVPWLRRLMLIGIGIACFQQLTGVNSVMYYGTQVLEQAGFTRNAALTFNVLSGVMAVLAVGVAMALVNRYPRRTFMLTGYIGTTTAHILIGCVGMFLPDDNPFRPWLLLILILGFIGVMQGGLGPVLFVLLSEIFPLKVRGLMVGVTMLALWVTNSVIALAFPTLIKALGFGTFWLFAVIGVFAIWFVAVAVPETRGRTLEEIEDTFRTRVGR